ncbi:MAG: amidase [Saprospiraceae bacterium]|nr:amidase [Saprospiraceae bacterium]
MISKFSRFFFILLWLVGGILGQSVIAQSVDDIPYIYNKEHQISRMRFKVLFSNVRDHFAVTSVFKNEITLFGREKYESLMPLILEKDIPYIQKQIDDNLLTYKDLVTFYVYRIHEIEGNKDMALNAIMSLNKDAIREAEICDKERKRKKRHPIYGMPLLLKDNIGYDGLPTTAGAEILKNNLVKDAFIVKKLKEKGAIILGKTNLSEWAYYFCSGCPLGYSAVGGQSLNPYGRFIFETGGSSSGSGTAIAANLAVAAIGTETSGSILSPSSLNSVTGLKPTVGTLSRTGIIPISSTLDTPGPMTKNVTDNAILMDAMTGYDKADPSSKKNSGKIKYQKALKVLDLNGKRIGMFKHLMENSGYVRISEILKKSGAKIIILDAQSGALQGFLSILNIDMKNDLQAYLSAQTHGLGSIKNVMDIMNYNRENMALRAPYGQALFNVVVTDTTSATKLVKIKNDLESSGKSFFNDMIKKHQLDLILSVNNQHAAIAAVAKFPCLTLPMGYKDNGEPHGITLILPSGQEEKLYSFAFTIESRTHFRIMPKAYN